MSTDSYQIFYDELPLGHPLLQNERYQAFVRQRQEISEALQGEAIPQDAFGFIVEVNTSAHWTVRQPQVVVGDIQERVSLHLKEGHCLDDGLSGLFPVREPVFLPSSPTHTMYNDRELAIAARPLGESTWGIPPVKRAPNRADPMRYRQHQQARRKTVRQTGGRLGKGGGATFTTDGNLLATVLHTGNPVWPHMLLRILVGGTYGRALALSFLGEKAAFFPDERRDRRGICYQVLFRPESGRR